MRDMIWNAVRSKVPEGMILPWWALTVRAALFPLDFFYWRMSQTRGYQWQNDTWLIEGVTYSGTALRYLAKAQGEMYRVTRTGETVTLERVHNAIAHRPVEAEGRNGSGGATGCAANGTTENEE